jgi:hypothetical protein
LALTIGGGSARPGGGCGGGHKSQISLPSHLKYTKTAKNGRFRHILAYKLPNTPIFAQKYLTRYTQKTFFEEYINFKNHYLAIAELYLLKVLDVIYAPSRPD